MKNKFPKVDESSLVFVEIFDLSKLKFELFKSIFGEGILDFGKEFK